MTDLYPIALEKYGELQFEQSLILAEDQRNIPKENSSEVHFFYGSSIPDEWIEEVEEVYLLLFKALGSYKNYVHAWWEPGFDNTKVLNGLFELGFFNSDGEVLDPSIEFIVSKESCLSGFNAIGDHGKQKYNYSLCNSWNPFTAPRLEERREHYGDNGFKYHRYFNLAHEYFHHYQRAHSLGALNVYPDNAIAPVWAIEGIANVFAKLFMKDNFNNLSLSKKLEISYEDISSVENPDGQRNNIASGIESGTYESSYQNFKKLAIENDKSVNASSSQETREGSQGGHHYLWEYMSFYLMKISSPQIMFVDLWEDSWELGGFANSFIKHVGLTLDEFYDEFNNFFKSDNYYDFPPKDFFIPERSLSSSVDFWSIDSGPDLVFKSYSGDLSEYKFFNRGNDNYDIQVKCGCTQSDPITGISAITFTNGTSKTDDDVTLNIVKDIKGVFDQITGLHTDSGEMFRLYNAAFSRFPDADGLRYWIDQFSSGKNSRRVVAQSFLGSAEFTEKYGSNVSDETYVNNLYKNVLGRDADAEGLNYWVGNLSSGLETRYEALLGFAESAENKALFTEMTGFG